MNYFKIEKERMIQGQTTISYQFGGQATNVPRFQKFGEYSNSTIMIDHDQSESINNEKIKRTLSTFKQQHSWKAPSMPALNRTKSEEKQKRLREKKLSENRKKSSRVRFSDCVKKHDGLEPQNLVINTLVWECFNMRIRCVGDVLKKIQPKHLHLLAGAYEHLSILCTLSKENQSRRFKILPRGGGKQLEIDFHHHYRYLRALREIIRKTHNRLHIAANEALKAKKTGNEATEYVLRHMEWQERCEQEARGVKKLAERQQCREKKM